MKKVFAFMLAVVTVVILSVASFAEETADANEVEVVETAISTEATEEVEGLVSVDIAIPEPEYIPEPTPEVEEYVPAPTQAPKLVTIVEEEEEEPFIPQTGLSKTTLSFLIVAALSCLIGFIFFTTKKDKIKL